MMKLCETLRRIVALSLLCSGIAVAGAVTAAVLSQNAFAQLPACDGLSCANDQPCGTLCVCNKNGPTCVYNGPVEN
jgi:hypothetical protein